MIKITLIHTQDYSPTRLHIRIYKFTSGFFNTITLHIYVCAVQREAMFKVREKRCSFNQTVYEKDRDSFNCQSSINVYHCIQNERNRSGEICIQPVWVQPNYCPEYNTGANTLDTVPCNESITGSCPHALFLSNEVYKYPVCLSKTFTDSKDVSKENDPLTPEIYIGVAVGVSSFIILLAACLILYYCRRDFNLEKPFYKTSAFYEGVKFINNDGKILCLVGLWGSGKRSTAKQIYVAVTNSLPIIIGDPLTFDVTEHHEPIIVDMTLSIEISESKKETLAEKIRMLFENMSSSNTHTKAFIIFLIDEDRANIGKFVRSLGKETKFIDLSKSLTKGDRTQMLYSQFETFYRNKNFSEVEKLAIEKGNDHLLGYSEICALFCRCTYFQNVGPVLFRNRPLQHLKSYLQKMHESDEKEQFLMLVYMSLNQMEINVNNPNDNLFEILESCKCVPTTKETKNSTKQTEITGTEVTLKTSVTGHESSSENKPKKRIMSRENIISLIPMEFVNKLKVQEACVYRIQHDVIKRMTLIVFGTYHFDKLLELSEPEELKEYIKKQSKTAIVAHLSEMKPVLEIGGKQWSQYQEKLK
ncbi:uncharacterized protein LOC128192256 isoform X2 [Crassostrea angulata]|uniref:uncharacterized protein LOC128192256 isoform X2 n=1 Tax=Magallana angulata TaxID=2784310 RepID=UPI0022B0D08B|nr:uncharacterized protein LOC128192256 isoform X2 [Crassostrea angulata]